MFDDRALSAGEYLLGAAELGLIVVALAFCAVRLRRLALPGFTGSPALVADAVGTMALATVLAELLGTFELFTEAGYLIGALVVAAIAVFIPAPAPPGASTRAIRPPRPGPPPGPADRRHRRRGDLRRMGDPHAQRHHRGHGQGRFALVPHAALVQVRRDGLDGRDLLLRPDLLRVLLPGELRGPARDPDPHLHARLPLAAPEPRLPQPRPARGLGDGQAVRPRAAGPPGCSGRPGRRDDDRLPGRRGAQRRRGRRASSCALRRSLSTATRRGPTAGR